MKGESKQFEHFGFLVIPKIGNVGFFKKMEDISPFYVATDTPVLNSWWHLFYVSKPEWAALFTLGRGICVIYFQRFTSYVTPADLLVARMAAKPISSMYPWVGIGGARNQDISYHRQTLYLAGIFDNLMDRVNSHLNFNSKHHDNGKCEVLLPI